MQTILYILSALVFALWLYLAIRPAHFPASANKFIAKAGLLVIAVILLLIAATIR
ncbi:MAG: hypothetical protein M3Z21_02760 [Pseudomonadota bacterium]|nr:hypothetical protein [Pseudomonadota bacterium]